MTYFHNLPNTCGVVTDPLIYSEIPVIHIIYALRNTLRMSIHMELCGHEWKTLAPDGEKINTAFSPLISAHVGVFTDMSFGARLLVTLR